MSGGGISGLIVQHQLLLALVAVVVAVGLLIDLIPNKRRRPWRDRRTWRRPKWGQGGWRRDIKPAVGVDYRPSPLDPADQLRLVMESHFTIRPVLNKSEARVFRELAQLVEARNPAWQVLAQDSLGEILSSQDPAAYACINSKRVDLLLMDGDCQPRHVLEYQGSGHHQGTAAARDAVKKEALRRAGIGYHEVVAGHTTPVDLRRLVDKLVDRPEAAKPPEV